MAYEYLESLNPEQLEATIHSGSPLLILAGAGSGKTRTITTKIAYLIQHEKVPPYSILAVTFTKKAANEMQERAIALESECAKLMIKTFHSFGAWFLRRYAEKVGVDPFFTVYDDEDSASLIREAFPDITKKIAAEYAKKIALCKDYCLSPNDNLSEIDGDEKLKEVYSAYQSRLLASGNCDFGDLIMLPVKLLESDPELRLTMQARFKVIMVDEYQDSNIAQFRLLQALSGVEENSGTYVCVVGDDDQSIYKFRGAEVKNILDFSKHFKNTKIIRLEKNYRSTGKILAAADAVVSHNSQRLGKTLVPVKGEGTKPALVFLENQDRESEFCAELIKEAVASGSKYSDFAVLYRTNSQSLGFEKEFLHKKIPYKIVGSLKFYEREEIKDALSYLALFANEKNSVAFSRIVNKPARGIGPTTQIKISQAFLDSKESLIESDSLISLAESFIPSLPKKSATGIKEFVSLYKDMKSFLEEQETENSKRLASNSKNIQLQKAQTVNTMEFADNLTDFGYIRVPKVTAKGEFCLRGEVLDVFLQKSQVPFRFVFDFDKIESIKSFDLSTQSTIAELDSLSIYPVGEVEKNSDSFSRLSVFVQKLLENSGLIDYHKAQDDSDGTNRVNNLQELINAAEPYPLTKDGLLAFLDSIELDRSLINEGDSSDDSVTLITLHNTKGLEFPKVIITGLEEGIFPRPDKFADELEEERRLFYVGITRAKDELYITTCAMRRLYGKTQPSVPSRFLFDAGNTFEPVGNVPFSFRQYKKNDESREILGPKAEILAKWKKGVNVYNDDYGYGQIIKSNLEGEEVVILIKFENGQQKKFMPEYQSSKLDIIKD